MCIGMDNWVQLKKKMGVGRFFTYSEKPSLLSSDNLYLSKRTKVGYKYFPLKVSGFGRINQSFPSFASQNNKLKIIFHVVNNDLDDR